MYGGIYFFYFLTKKFDFLLWKKNPKRANPFWSFVCTYSPLILLLGISHCSRLMPIFGTPPSTQLGKRGQRFAHWLPQKMCKKPHPNLNQTLNTQQPRRPSARFGRYLEFWYGKNILAFIPTIFYYYIVVLERTPKYQTSNTSNIDCPNIELSEHHILAQNRISNMSNITRNWTVSEHQTVCFKTSLVT